MDIYSIEITLRPLGYKVTNQLVRYIYLPLQKEVTNRFGGGWFGRRQRHGRGRRYETSVSE